MQPLYAVGENTAFGPVPSNFTVVSVRQWIAPDGQVVEEMVDSGNNITRSVRGVYVEEDYAYRPVTRPPRRGGVLVPFTYRRTSVVEAAPKDAEWVDVSGADQDYWRVLCDYWEPSFDLAICEHDVVWRQDVTDAFNDCPEPWCVFPYSDHAPLDAEAWGNLLGCTRFRRELIESVPDAVSSIEERFRNWHYVCDGLGKALRAAGFAHHWHGPPVVHDHVGPVEPTG